MYANRYATAGELLKGLDKSRHLLESAYADAVKAAGHHQITERRAVVRHGGREQTDQFDHYILHQFLHCHPLLYYSFYPLSLNLAAPRPLHLRHNLPPTFPATSPRISFPVHSSSPDSTGGIFTLLICASSFLVTITSYDLGLKFRQRFSSSSPRSVCV